MKALINRRNHPALLAAGFLLMESIRYRTIQWQVATFSFGLF